MSKAYTEGAAHNCDPGRKHRLLCSQLREVIKLYFIDSKALLFFDPAFLEVVAEQDNTFQQQPGNLQHLHFYMLDQ